MSNTFDVIIVGGGPAGLFAAWWLADHSDLSVCIVERGNMVKKRGCPLGKAKKCMKCISFRGWAEAGCSRTAS